MIKLASIDDVESAVFVSLLLLLLLLLGPFPCDVQLLQQRSGRCPGDLVFRFSFFAIFTS